MGLSIDGAVLFGMLVCFGFVLVIGLSCLICLLLKV